MLLTRLGRENKNMDKEKLKFYSIGRGSLNLNGKFYYGLDYAITDFMMDLEQQCKKQKEVIDKAMSKLDIIIYDLDEYDEAPAPSKEELCEIFGILKEVSKWVYMKQI